MAHDAPAESRLDLDQVNRRLAEADAEQIVRWAVGQFPRGLVMTTSFGAQAAVMLHLVTRIVPAIPVVWIDTGFNFPETYRFAADLEKRLQLNLAVYQSALSPARMVALHGPLWEQGLAGLERYDQIRKVEPRDRAFRELGVKAWLTGPRREQTEFRRTLRPVEQFGPYCKVHPILAWTSRQVHAYLKQHDLPYHPLQEQGYHSIGDWHSTEALGGDGHERAGRFRGLKQECGLHLPQSDAENASRGDSGL